MYSRFPFPFQFNSLSLQCLHTEASLAGGADEGGDLYIGKALSDALLLTLRNLAFQTNRRETKQQ